MLTIFYGEKTTDNLGNPKFKGLEAKWALGSPAPEVPVLAAKTVIVEASERELQYIEGRFRNLPIVDKISPGSSITWTGDDARFIVVNLVD